MSFRFNFSLLDDGLLYECVELHGVSRCRGKARNRVYLYGHACYKSTLGLVQKYTPLKVTVVSENSESVSE